MAVLTLWGKNSLTAQMNCFVGVSLRGGIGEGEPVHNRNFWSNGLNMKKSGSQWPRSLRRRSAAVRLLGLLVKIPPGAWMSACCEFCVCMCVCVCVSSSLFFNTHAFLPNLNAALAIILWIMLLFSNIKFFRLDIFFFYIIDLELASWKDGNKFEILFNVNRHVKIFS
jgi:hypothetical protein